MDDILIKIEPVKISDIFDTSIIGMRILTLAKLENGRYDLIPVDIEYTGKPFIWDEEEKKQHQDRILKLVQKKIPSAIYVFHEWDELNYQVSAIYDLLLSGKKYKNQYK